MATSLLLVLFFYFLPAIYSQCESQDTTLCHSQSLRYHHDTFTLSSTIQITESTIINNPYHIYFQTNQYQCINPTLTIQHQQINTFNIQYSSNSRIKTIQCPISNHCSYTSCIINYPLIPSNQTIPPNSQYFLILNTPSIITTNCSSLYLNINITLSCSTMNPNTEIITSDWSTKTTDGLKRWWNKTKNYVTVGDRPIYFSIAGGILVMICICCCIACILQCRKPKNVKMHPNAKPAKKKKKIHDKKKYSSMGVFKSLSINSDYEEMDDDSAVGLAIIHNNKNKSQSNKSKEILKHKQLTTNGVIYLQTQYYDEKQMNNIKNAFGDNYRKAPKILFGDNYADKKRKKHVLKRSKYAGQSKIMGKYDRKYGFGIPTTFDDAKECGFHFTDKNFKGLIENEFKILRKHLSRGADIIIPCPTRKDLQQRPNKYFKNGDYNSDQVIFHNLGTGISSLSFQNLLVIQQNINALQQSASAVIKVSQKLYDRPYNSSDEEDEDDKIIEEFDPLLQSLSNEENVVIPVFKENQNSSAQGEYVEFIRGLLIFQTAWYSQEQMQFIRAQCKSKDDVRKLGKMVFGDNDVDKFRKKGVKRIHYGGQAMIMGPYDKLFAYGITTTFVESSLPDIKNFMLFIDQQFQPLQQHLLKGYDVVIPKPRKHDVNANKKNYYKNGKQVIFHNIGTGIASLPFEYVAYIQQKIDELKNYARDTKTVKYYNYSPLSMDSGGVADDMKHQQERYCCPLCTEERHYLINLKNCTHSICEECLTSYIYQCLIYLDNPMEHRFKCWAAANSKCPDGHICLDDINYADDRCECERCTKDNSVTGTDTILDVERYKQFVNVINAMNLKSKWDKVECPECLKPFPVDKPWKKKNKSLGQSMNDNEGTGYNQDDEDYDQDYVRKKTFFSKNMDHCNCCGEKVKNNGNNGNNDMKEEYSHHDEEEEEVATTAYSGFNNCGVCNYYYCDQCRRNCFYEIEQRFTVKPPSPVQDAIIEFNIQQQLRQKSYGAITNDDNESKNDGHCQVFECCEICWYRYYCRKCPHCNYRFCSMCNSEWNGCTQNYMESDYMKIVGNIDDDKEDEIMDEKHRKHDNKSKHSCKESKAKMAEIQRKRKEKREKKKNETIQELAKKKDEAEYQMKHQQYLLDKQKKELEEAQREIAEWKAKALEKENDKLAKEKKTQQMNLKKTQIEKEQFRQKAEEEKQKAIEVGKEVDKLRKKIGYVTMWQWQDDDGKNWKSYDYDINKAIEKLKINQCYTYLCAANRQNYKITKSSKDGGIQTNTKTSVSRKIRRQRIERGLDCIKYPKWWNMAGLQLNAEPGSSLNAMYAKPKLIELNLWEHPAKNVMNAFYKTCNGYTIIKIESVENQMLFDAYWNVRSKMLKLVGNNRLNERELYHGTGSDDVMKLVQKEGFRKEFNKTAMYGKGTYFARDSSYSVRYSSNNNGIYKMFQCKVVCGETYAGIRGYELNKWPKKDNGLIYDSLVDNKGNPSIFVIHDDVRAYPMFVIHFKKSI